MFPLLGRTPPPWRWPPDVIATAIATHIAYVVGVGGGGRRAGSPGVLTVHLSPGPYEESRRLRSRSIGRCRRPQHNEP